MTQEEVKYEVKFNPLSGLYHSEVQRKLNGRWDAIHMDSHLTMWGAKLHSKRWIKKWAKGKFKQRSYMNVVTVDRKW